MNLKKLIRLISSLIIVFGAFLLPAPPSASAKSSLITFTLNAPGVALQQPDTLLVAVRLENTSKRTAFKVKVNSIRLSSASLLTPLPVQVGKIGADQSAIVQVRFDSSQMTQGKQYELVMRGSYRPVNKGTDQDQGHVFTVRIMIELPLLSPGSGLLDKAKVVPHQVSDAPYPPQPPEFDEEETNPPGWTVPTGPFAPGLPTPDMTAALPFSKIAQNAHPRDAAGVVVFSDNRPVGITNGSTIAEPSGATGGGVVFVTSNWFAAYSANGGGSFTRLNPTTIFPGTGVGFCCDQIVQYVPSIDRFIWLMQGNGMRVASASPANIISSGGTAWTYWDLTPNIFGAIAGTGFDYPDLSVGNNFLYLSWNAGFPCPAGCNWGHQVARISLAGLQAGGTITVEFTNPANSRNAWGAHLMQNTLDEIFWAGHVDSSHLTVWSLQEGTNTYFWRDVGISSWANNALSSTTPDGQNWLTGSGGFPGNAIIGATRSGNQLWFGWNAGTDSFFQQAHIELVTLDRNNNFNRIQQVQIWNNSYAFAYPAMATNACTGEVGLSFEYGGNGNYQNHVVGFWGDFIAYITTQSNVGTTRFGDYVTIRQEPATGNNFGNLFNAYGYGLNTVPPPGSGTQTDIHYVLFGRPAAGCSGPD
jgi:hypothetical protein